MIVSSADSRASTQNRRISERSRYIAEDEIAQYRKVGIPIPPDVISRLGSVLGEGVLREMLAVEDRSSKDERVQQSVKSPSKKKDSAETSGLSLMSEESSLQGIVAGRAGRPEDEQQPTKSELPIPSLPFEDSVKNRQEKEGEFEKTKGGLEDCPPIGNDKFEGALDTDVPKTRHETPITPKTGKRKSKKDLELELELGLQMLARSKRNSKKRLADLTFGLVRRGGKRLKEADDNDENKQLLAEMNAQAENLRKDIGEESSHPAGQNEDSGSENEPDFLARVAEGLEEESGNESEVEGPE